MVPRENKSNIYTHAKFWRDKQREYCGIFESGLFISWLFVLKKLNFLLGCFCNSRNDR